MRQVLLTLLLAATPIASATAQQTDPNQIADEIAERTNRLTTRGRQEFNIWHSERYDAVNATMMVYACADFRYLAARLGPNPADTTALSALAEQRQTARQGVFDFRTMLYRSVLEKLDDENLVDAAIIAGGAAEAYAAYGQGYDAALRRGWRQNAAMFEADCSR